MNKNYDPLANVQAAGPPGSISFIYGLPDPDTFPLEELHSAFKFVFDDGERVIRFGSFSKIIAPGLRLGWILGPENIIKRLIRSGLRSMGGGANPLSAVAMATFCRKGIKKLADILICL